MRKLLVAFFLSLSLAGCGTSLLVHEAPTAAQAKADPVKAAQQAIDQAYATHASITATLAQNYHDGIITKGEKDAYAVRTRQALTSVDSADDLLGSGDLSGSSTALAVANASFTLIQQELARLAAKGK